MKAAMGILIVAGCVVGGCNVIQPPDVVTRGELSAVILQIGPGVDGTLDDPTWAECPPLVLGACGSDEVGELKSTARVLLDANTLYVAVECLDPDTARLRVDAVGRDADLWTNDSVDIFVHAQGAGEARHFIVACNGELLDALETGGTGDATWNSTARVRVKVKQNDRWIVTMAVPLADLGAKPGKDQTWRLNINRTRPSENEDARPQLSSWSRSGRNDYHDPSGWGKLTRVNVP